ncbi:MAG: thioredoxin [Planctomycetales bacterium]
MSAISHVSVENFKAEVVDSSVPVLVDFYADWCGPCRMLAPTLEALAREHAGRVKIVKVNVDEEPELAGHFRVQSIPTLLAFQEGRHVDTLVGVGSPGQLRQVLTKLAASPGRAAVRVG